MTKINKKPNSILFFFISFISTIFIIYLNLQPIRVNTDYMLPPFAAATVILLLIIFIVLGIFSLISINTNKHITINNFFTLQNSIILFTSILVIFLSIFMYGKIVNINLISNIFTTDFTILSILLTILIALIGFFFVLILKSIKIDREQNQELLKKRNINILFISFITVLSLVFSIYTTYSINHYSSINLTSSLIYFSSKVIILITINFFLLTIFALISINFKNKSKSLFISKNFIIILAFMASICFIQGGLSSIKLAQNTLIANLLNCFAVISGSFIFLSILLGICFFYLIKSNNFDYTF